MKKLLSLALVLVTITSLFSTPLFAGETSKQSFKSEENIMNSSEIMSELINKGKKLIKEADEKDYAEGESALSHLKTSIEYSESTRYEPHRTISNIVVLKRAIANLNSRKYMPEEALVPLKVVEEKLNEYKTKYYDLLSETKKNELDELIELIKTYTDEESDAKLTKGVFDGIMKREKPFDDPIVVLTVVLNSARILLFKDPNDPSKGYYYDRGDEIEDYIKDLTLYLHKPKPFTVEAFHEI
ncbi:MAG: hypothetical protein K8R73_03110 [Clostridiales bacterium]|nr:hypothetical protein [Clostridiales bacterium]